MVMMVMETDRTIQLFKRRQRTDMINLKQLNQMVISEINRHKWIESEKAGSDIGEMKAATEWIECYYDDWLANFLSGDQPASR